MVHIFEREAYCTTKLFFIFYVFFTLHLNLERLQHLYSSLWTYNCKHPHVCWHLKTTINCHAIWEKIQFWRPKKCWGVNFSCHHFAHIYNKPIQPQVIWKMEILASYEWYYGYDGVLRSKSPSLLVRFPCSVRKKLKGGGTWVWLKVQLILLTFPSQQPVHTSQEHWEALHRVPALLYILFMHNSLYCVIWILSVFLSLIYTCFVWQ